jgi:hypothetical protein
MADTIEEYVAQRNAFATLAMTHFPYEPWKSTAYERALNQFPKLIAHPGFKSVATNLETKLLCIATKTIYHRDSDRLWREVGEIICKCDVKERLLRFENTQQRVNTYQHPHITEGGVLCFHSGMENLKRLLSEGRYLELFNELWELLSAFGPGNSPYIPVSNWPLAPQHIQELLSCPKND